MAKIIECIDLHVRYRAKNGAEVHAVRGLDLHVEQGEVVGFLGPNGAGKSSTLKALMGYVFPSQGACTLFGHSAGSAAARRQIGYLPEVAMYYPYLTPLETLTLYGELQGLSGKSLRSEAGELLALVGLEGSERKQNRTLSKGMLQRVGIAQSLLGNPPLLVLDEVTSGLDPIGRRDLRSLLVEKNRAGTTLFFSSHELSEVAQICDRILLLDRGRLIEERKLGELQDSLRKHMLVYFGEDPLLDLACSTEWLEGGVRRATFAAKDGLVQAIERVVRSGGCIVDVASEEGSLETYFIESIGAAA